MEKNCQLSIVYGHNLLLHSCWQKFLSFGTRKLIFKCYQRATRLVTRLDYSEVNMTNHSQDITEK